MVGYRRNFLPGGTFFFTVNLRDRRTTLLTDHIDLLRNATRAVRSKRPFEVVAVVVLPDHLHAIWQLPDNDADYETRWRLIKSSFTKALNTTERVWQHRYWEHTIRDDLDLQRHVDYIHWNPVKHGHVARPVDWPHSSIHRFIREELLRADWAVGDVAGEF